MLELAPLNFFPRNTKPDFINLMRWEDGLHGVVSYSLQVLDDVLMGYGRIVSYFKDIIIEKDVFLDAAAHDALLFDNESFSRSKRYFWAITTLKEINHAVMGNIQEIENLLALKTPRESIALFFDDRKHLVPEMEPQLNMEQVQLKEAQERLRLISATLRRMPDEVTELRNGASIVPKTSIVIKLT
jgi:hypothetical protein